VEDPNILILTPTIALSPASAAAGGASHIGAERAFPYPDKISLFDLKKNLIAGAPCDFDILGKNVKTPVTVDGKTVAWLGIDLGPQEVHPKDQELMKGQINTFNAVGALTLLVSTIVLFFFSKHLLSPIEQLSSAMKALTDRCFGTRIPVKRNDEFGILATRFNTMARQLQEYDRNQQRWLSDISHELRTPLSVLIGEIEAFRDDVLKLDEASLRALGDEAKYLRRIVEDLHFISLAESTSLSMEKEPIRPLMVLTQAIYFFENRLKQKGVSIKVALAPAAVDLEIAGDRVRIRQVFSNLIENALQYMDKPGLLTVRGHSEDGRLVIVFEDSGPGVPAHDLPHLFERLYKADPSRSRKAGGSGIGLAICKTIVNGHNGTIAARNAEGGGLMIEISLPISGGDAENRQEEEDGDGIQ
jgi:two-component system sensor histidine kinase BaeS